MDIYLSTTTTIIISDGNKRKNINIQKRIHYFFLIFLLMAMLHTTEYSMV